MKNIVIKSDDGSATLYSERFGESYHSTKGAVAESLYIFIGCGLEYYINSIEGKREGAIKILEIGFGTGLNCLLSCILAEKLCREVEYTAIDKYPISIDEALSLNHAEYLEPEEGVIRGYSHSIQRAAWGEVEKISRNFSLHKVDIDVRHFVTDRVFDVVYFDAFSPDRQPEMWDRCVIQAIRNNICKNGILVTYSSKGLVKQNLRDCGFEIERLPGPSGKRHIVRAIAVD